MTTPRPKSRDTENENQRPDKAGHPPRPATEPKGAEGSSNSGRTETDPATGQPNDGAFVKEKGPPVRTGGPFQFSPRSSSEAPRASR